MVAETYHRRWPSWTEIVLTIALIGGLGGFLVYLRFGGKPPEIPHDEYTDGCELLAEGKAATGDPAKSKLDDAVTTFTKVIKKNHGHSRAFFQRAEAYKLQGNPDAVIADCTEGLLLDPENAAGYCCRAAAYLEKGWLELAIDDLTKATSLAPNSHAAFCLRTRANLLAGKYAEAVADAQSAIRLNPASGAAPHTSAPSLAPHQETDRTVPYLLQAIQPDDTLTARGKADLARAYFNLGLSLVGDGRRPAADQAIEKAVQLDPNYGKLYATYNGLRPHKTARPILPQPTLPELKLQAFEALRQSLFADALERFNDILEVDAKCADPWVWWGRGRAFLEAHDPNPVSAVLDFERAIYLAPDFAEAYCLRGQAYLQMAEYGRATSDTTKAIGLTPDSAPAYFYRALALCKNQSPDLALADLHEAVELDPRLTGSASALYAEIYESQADTSRAARRWVEAIASLRQALVSLQKIAPPDKDHVARLAAQLAQAYAERGAEEIAAERWDEAIAILEHALPADKDNDARRTGLLAQAYRERGLDRAQHGDFPAAVRDVNQALDVDRDHAQTCSHCGLTCGLIARNCRDHGQLADALRLWDAAIHLLNRAIRLAPARKYEWQPALEDAQRNLDQIHRAAS